ncbi:hypothetical protein YC2023_115380 [Brassica napus]
MKEMRLWWSFMPITLTTLLATNFTSRGDFSFATHFEDSKKRPTVAIGRENQWAKRSYIYIAHLVIACTSI